MELLGIDIKELGLGADEEKKVVETLKKMQAHYNQEHQE
jgi:hypothetical protein